ncbi:hypothetical protein GYA49_00315 [Candidatus Beckwithbacteria bacterium]|nr:hypothetical protein [Candidatus Beckwithbacteria bacterium]
MVKNKNALYLVVIFLATIFAYSNIFANQFLGDDYDFVVNWQSIHNFQKIPQLLKGEVPAGNEGVYRPVRSLVYVLVYSLSNVNPLGYHIFSLIIHLASVFLTYFFIKTFFKKPLLAFLSALLFALHPIHTESITYITSSFDAFGFMLFFGALTSFAYFLKKKKAYVLYVSYALVFLAFFSHEMTLALPLLLLLLIFTFKKKADYKITIPYFVLAALYGCIRIFIIHTPARSQYLANSFYLTFLAVIKAFWLAFKTTLFPYHLTLDHHIYPNLFTFSNYQLLSLAALQQHWYQPVFLLSLGFLALFLVTVFYFFKKNPIVSFSLIWFFLTLLPVANIVPNYTLFREMYLYIPSFGICLALAYLGTYLLKKNQQLGIIVISVVIILFGIRTYFRNLDWQNELMLWQKTAESSAQNPMVLYKLGSAYQAAGQADQAIGAYKSALILQDDMGFVYYNLGLLHQQQKQVHMALGYYEKAWHRNTKEALPPLIDLYNQEAIKQFQNGEVLSAQTYLQKALDLDLCSAQTFNNYGSIVASQGDYFKAKVLFEQALNCDPNFTQAQENLEKLEMKKPF